MIGPKGENLIFLISQPRSGSTLLQLMLSSHPDIATTVEPWIALHPLYALREKGISAEYDSQSANTSLMAFLKECNIDKAFYKKCIANMLTSLYDIPLSKSKKSFFLDKTPRYYEIASELALLFPSAKFIVLKRNPLAVLNSMLTTWFDSDISYLSRCKRDLLAAPELIADFSKKYSDRLIEIKYEDLLQSPPIIMREIIDFIGLPMCKSSLKYDGEKKWSFGDQKVKNSSSPVAENIDAWKNGFDTKELQCLAASYIEEMGHDLVNTLGYDYCQTKQVICKEKIPYTYKMYWKSLRKDNVNIVEQMEYEYCLSSIKRDNILFRSLILMNLLVTRLRLKVFTLFGRG